MLCTGIVDLTDEYDKELDAFQGMGRDIAQSFRIWTKGPGHLVAGDSIWQLEVRAGCVRSIAPLSMISPACELVSEVASIVQGRLPSTSVGIDLESVVFASLSQMLRLAIDKNHGAAFVILPSTVSTPMDARIACKYPSGGIDLVESIKRVAIADGQSRAREQSRLYSDISALSELSAVDGCVVLSRDLKLLGFGGEILVSEQESRTSNAMFTRLSGEVFENADNYEQIMESFGGTRHRSAARLCRGVSDVIVFVISQDGDLKMLCNSDGGVYPYGPMDTRRMGASLD